MKIEIFIMDNVINNKQNTDKKTGILAANAANQRNNDEKPSCAFDPSSAISK